MILTSALHGEQGDVCLELFVCVDLDCCGEEGGKGAERHQGTEATD